MGPLGTLMNWKGAGRWLVEGMHDGRLRELARFVQVGLCLLNRSVPCRTCWLVGKRLFLTKMKDDVLALVPFFVVMPT